jgi:two-component system, chemotaxis family, CheB/CheR fusion protein
VPSPDADAGETLSKEVLPLDPTTFRTAIEALDETIIITSPELDEPGPQILYVNPAFTRMTGYSPHEVIGRTPRLLQGPLTDRAEMQRLKTDLAEEGRFFGEAINYRKDGSTYVVEWLITALRDGAGRIAQWVAVQRDITQRHRLEVTNAHLAAVVEAQADAVVSFSLDGTILSWNPAAKKIFGYTAGEAVGSSVGILLPHDRAHEVEVWLAQARQGETVRFEAVRRRKDTTLFDAGITLTPIRNATGVVVGFSGFARDITEIKRAAEHQKLLINELNHRVKNTLATVQSITTQTLRNTSSPEQARGDIDERLVALSRAHDVLTRENWDGANLREIVAQAVEPYSSRGENRLHLTGPDVRLSPRTALALAMALQELATNAVKYGALSNEVGEIRITWSIDQVRLGKRLQLRWEEKGGPVVRSPTRRGFGSRLIERSLGQDLDGEVLLDFAPDGVVCMIDAALFS